MLIIIAIGLLLTAIVVGWFITKADNDDGQSLGLLSAFTQSEKISAVTSSHYLATDAGMFILDNGGTAADAAVATAAVLSVVEPWFSSVLGGGTWALYYDAENDTVTSLDGVGVTGSKATAADYAERAGDPGMHQANVPGAWSGWLLWLEEYGTMELGEVLAPAIKLAREGFPASAEMVYWLNNQEEVTMDRPEAVRIYAPNGDFVEEGDTVYQLDFANTLEELVFAYNNARVGESRAAALAAAHDYFYRGPIARAIVSYSNEHNGYLTLADFSDTKASLLEPLSIDYNGIEVFENPPNSQGITMLIALNILKDYDFSQFSADSAEAKHLQAEALKLAFADRYYHVADPRLMSAGVVRGLLSEAHAVSQRQRIHMDSVLEWPITDGYEPIPEDLANTTTFHIVDKHGNGAAVTTSLGAQFLVVGDTGIHINHRMRFMQVEDEEGGLNMVNPGFKVRHTSNPYMAFRNGSLYILGGNTGADSQVQGQIQQFINVVEYNMSPQEAVTAPRFITNAFPGTVYPYPIRNTLQLEDGFSESVATALQNLGHDVVLGEGTWGNAQMLVVQNGGEDVDIGSDPRNPDSKGDKKPVR